MTQTRKIHPSELIQDLNKLNEINVENNINNIAKVITQNNTILEDTKSINSEKGNNVFDKVLNIKLDKHLFFKFFKPFRKILN
jgi:hypothetical protein